MESRAFATVRNLKLNARARRRFVAGEKRNTAAKHLSAQPAAAFTDPWHALGSFQTSLSYMA
jgi:hypothetical protein